MALYAMRGNTCDQTSARFDRESFHVMASFTKYRYCSESRFVGSSGLCTLSPSVVRTVGPTTSNFALLSQTVHDRLSSTPKNIPVASCATSTRKLTTS